MNNDISNNGMTWIFSKNISVQIKLSRAYFFCSALLAAIHRVCLGFHLFESSLKTSWWNTLHVTNSQLFLNGIYAIQNSNETLCSCCSCHGTCLIFCNNFGALAVRILLCWLFFNNYWTLLLKNNYQFLLAWPSTILRNNSIWIGRKNKNKAIKFSIFFCFIIKHFEFLRWSFQ